MRVYKVGSSRHISPVETVATDPQYTRIAENTMVHSIDQTDLVT